MTPASKCLSHYTKKLLAVCASHLATPVATRHPHLPLRCYSLRCCVQGGTNTEALVVADSIKHVVQHSRETALDDRQASQPPGCIIISDSEDEPDISGHAAADAPPPRSSPPFSLDGPIRNVVGHTCKSAVCTTARKSSSCESDGLLASKRHKPLQRQSEASNRVFISDTRNPAKAPNQLFSTSSTLGDVKCEADREADMMQQEKEAGPAFEVPSQMPRELKSWAWDKYACCLQQDTMHMLLPACIVRLLLLQCYVFAVQKVTHCLLIVCPEPIQ